MTLQLLAQILLWSFGVMLLFGLCVVIYVIGRNSVNEDSEKAIIFRKNGNQLAKPKIYKLVIVASKGIGFIFNKKIVIIPTGYNNVRHKGKRVIFINHAGQIIASPFTDDKKLSTSEKETIIYDFIESNVGSGAIKAIKGKQTIGLLIVGIAAFIFGAIAVFGVIQFQTYMKQQQAPAPVTEQAPVKPSVPDDTIIY